MGIYIYIYDYIHMYEQEPNLGSCRGVDANGGEARLKAAAPGGELWFLHVFCGPVASNFLFWAGVSVCDYSVSAASFWGFGFGFLVEVYGLEFREGLRVMSLVCRVWVSAWSALCLMKACI